MVTDMPISLLKRNSLISGHKSDHRLCGLGFLRDSQLYVSVQQPIFPDISRVKKNVPSTEDRVAIGAALQCHSSLGLLDFLLSFFSGNRKQNRVQVHWAAVTALLSYFKTEQQSFSLDTISNKLLQAVVHIYQFIRKRNKHTVGEREPTLKHFQPSLLFQRID